MDKKLIELVRDYPELYDRSHDYYTDNVHRNSIWNIIGRSLKKEGSFCRHRWLSLRDQYRKILRKRNTQRSPIKWRYDTQMSFLIPVMKRKPIKNEITQEEVSMAEWHRNGAEDTGETSDNDMSELLQQAAKEGVNFALGGKVIEGSEGSPVQKDPVDLFFEGIAATVKRFTPKDQNLIKREIFTIVNETEATYVNNI